MQADIVALLRLFRGRVPDPQTHGWALDVAADAARWKRAHAVFDRVRARNLRAIEAKDRARECQYCFEEVCLQSLYNETGPPEPFDACSPYWVIKNALVLARAIGVSVQDVAAVVAPEA
jgi:hypothetical protein